MSGNFFDFMYGVNKKDEPKAEVPAEKPVTDEAVAQDEAIGTPWTHKFTVYCANPSESFMEELKAKDGVVAVYVKEKTEKPAAVEDTSPDDK